ncbi:MAG: Wzz/FepE/Etk N-terminal domain-containing protein [Actinomycetes bacterium]
METNDYLGTLRSHWRVIASCVLLGVLLGALVSVSATKSYTATAQLFVSVKYYGGPAGGTVAGINSTSDFALAQVQSYARLAESPQVLIPAGKRLGSSIDSGRISAISPLNTVLIDVSANGSKASVAAAEANAVAAQLAAFIPSVETRLPDGSESVKATVTKPAAIPSDPTSPKVELNLGLGFLLGLATGLGLAMIMGQAAGGRGNATGGKAEPTSAGTGSGS